MLTAWTDGRRLLTVLMSVQANSLFPCAQGPCTIMCYPERICILHLSLQRLSTAILCPSRIAVVHLTVALGLVLTCACTTKSFHTEIQQVEELLGPPPTAPLSLAFGNSQGSECSSLSKFWSVLMVPPDEHQQQQLLQQQLHQQQLHHQQQQQQPHSSMQGSSSGVSSGGNGQPLGIPLQNGDSSLGLRGVTNRQGPFTQELRRFTHKGGMPSTSTTTAQQCVYSKPTIIIAAAAARSSCR
eukprot:1060-Heterococcus_DN1.PRE.3